MSGLYKVPIVASWLVAHILGNEQTQLPFFPVFHENGL